jgi:parvulin-like peptidyl-prolyl isomerase
MDGGADETGDEVTVRRLRSSAAAHFMALGAALFVFERYATRPWLAPRPTIVVSAARLIQLRAAASRGAAAASSEDTAILAQAGDEAILLREALALGIDRDDQSIRGRLTEKMRFLAESNDDHAATAEETLYHQALALHLDREDPLVRGLLVQKMRLLLKRSTPLEPPDDATLRAYMEQHPERYAQPARIDLHHVFLARQSSADEAPELVARTLRDRLDTKHVTAPDAVRLGDPFPAGGYLRAQSARELTRLFGPDFASAVMALAPRTWSYPIRSAYGMHLVWVDDKTGPGLPGVDAVRSRLTAQWTEERQMKQLETRMRELRAKYIVRVGTGTGDRG